MQIIPLYPIVVRKEYSWMRIFLLVLPFFPDWFFSTLELSTKGRFATKATVLLNKATSDSQAVVTIIKKIVFNSEDEGGQRKPDVILEETDSDSTIHGISKA